MTSKVSVGGNRSCADIWLQILKLYSFPTWAINMLKMKYPFYFINWLNNAIIKLNFIIIWHCFVIFGCI